MSSLTMRSRPIARCLGRCPALRPQAPRKTLGSCRYASTSTGASVQAGRVKVAVYAGALAASMYAGYLYITDSRASVHQHVVPRIIRTLVPDAEDAHYYGTVGLKALYEVNMHIRERDPALKNAPELQTTIFDTQVDNPVAISAGLDKDGEIPDVLFALGAGVVEIGAVTPLPQAGNPRPRVFRVVDIEGMVNRYGFNSRGADDVAMRLRDRLRRFARSLGVSERDVLDGDAHVPPGSLQSGRLLAVQVGKNKETDERDEKAVAADYTYCVKRLAPYADVLVVNVSSPNTPGLRELQATEPLTRLLTAVVIEASKTERKSPPKVMVKVSPDEDEDSQLEGIVQAVQRSGVDGVIVANTTRRRTGLVPDGVKLTAKEQNALMETGGFSGPTMFEQTLSLVGRYRKLLDSPDFQPNSGSDKQKVIFASGGITNGDEALKVLNAGASLAMIYTGMVYGGAGTVTRIKSEMKKQLQK